MKQSLLSYLAGLGISQGWIESVSLTTRNSKGRKRTTTAAQQKRDKIKRKNKGK